MNTSAKRTGHESRCAGAAVGKAGYSPATSEAGHAFSLIEVMIALGIFFMAVFTILALVSNTLRNARALQRPQIDAGMAAADYMATNRFAEGTRAGEFSDDLSDYSWEAETYEFATNGLLRADIVLTRRGSRGPPDTISILVFDPSAKAGPFGSGPFSRGARP